MGNYSYQPTYELLLAFQSFLVTGHVKLRPLAPVLQQHYASMIHASHQPPKPQPLPQLPYPPLQISVAKEWT